MEDMEKFTSVYVNPKLRKLRMEAYAIVASYPVDFPKIKNACLKWSWRQTPTKGWCQLPPNITHRFGRDPKYRMHDFLVTVETAMVGLSKLVSTVVEETVNLKARTRWIAEVEINLVTEIFVVPKKPEEGKTVKDQENELCEKCAAFIATKLLDLLKLGKPGLDHAALTGFKRSSALEQLVWKHLDDPKFCGSTIARNDGRKPNSVVTEKLVPKVIEMDADGVALSAHETVASGSAITAEVESIPWSTWAEVQTKRNPNNTAKLLLCMAIDTLHQNWITLPHFAGKNRQ